MDFPYCWSSMDSDDKFHPQTNSLMNMLNSLILGSEETSELVNMVQSEVTDAALAQKVANQQLKEIDHNLALSDYILQI